MPTYQDVVEAHERIKPFVHRTPVLTSQTLNKRLKAHIYLKAESFQKTGSFKFRGATNAVLQLTEDQRAKGVLTYSSGNHAQALALACRENDTACTVVMPHDAPLAKRQATEGYGAKVILYDKDETTREALAHKLATEHNLTIIPPFDHPHIVAGQGTAAKELLEETGPLDIVVACVGGGGLLSGTALSVRAACPNAQIIGVEPEAGNDVQQSIALGRIVTIPVPETIADGARTSAPSLLTFEVIRNNVDQIVTVTDNALLEVTHFLFHRLKIVVEPTGALALAALWSGNIDTEGKTIGVTISGGNCDVARLASLWTGAGL